MPDTQDLMNAINQGNLDEIQRIVDVRDANGVPRVDLNNLEGRSALEHALWVWPNKININIFQYLLNIRDHAETSVININQTDNHGMTIVGSIFFTPYLDERLRRQLLQSVLDMRDSQGEIIVNLQADCYLIPLLKSALRHNDIHCLRILLDTRLADGTKALDVNQVSKGTTLLDEALLRDNARLSYVSSYVYNEDVVNTIREAGGLQSAQLLQQQIPAVQHHNQRAVLNPQIAGEEAVRFDQNRQNTHDPSITHTAKGSVVALNQTYKDTLNEDKCIEEIETFINNYDYSSVLISLNQQEKKDGASEFFNLLKKNFTTIHSYTDYTIKKVLALVWMGIKDDNIDVFPEEIKSTLTVSIKTVPLSFVMLKKSSLIEKFIEASREYKEIDRALNICSGGSIHKLLEALNHAHRDVVITIGMQAVGGAANDMSIAIVGRQLMKSPQKNEILSAWDQDDNTIVSAFKESVKEAVEAGLKTHFGILLTKKSSDEIVKNILSMPRPAVPDKVLNAFVDTITNLPAIGDVWQKQTVNILQEFARQIYFREILDQEKHGLLKTEYASFLSINQLMKEINAETTGFILTKSNKQPNKIDLKQFEKHLIEKSLIFIHENKNDRNQVKYDIYSLERTPHLVLKKLKEQIRVETLNNFLPKPLNDNEVVNASGALVNQIKVLLNNSEEKLPLMDNNVYQRFTRERETLLSDIQSIHDDQATNLSQKKEFICDVYTTYKKSKAILLISELQSYYNRLTSFIEYYHDHLRHTDLVDFQNKIGDLLDKFELTIWKGNTDIAYLITKLNENIKKEITELKLLLENEPGIWRNLHPIIKAILGVLAALTVLPALIIENYSEHGYVGTFFIKHESSIKNKFKEKNLDIAFKDENMDTLNKLTR